MHDSDLLSLNRFKGMSLTTENINAFDKAVKDIKTKIRLEMDKELGVLKSIATTISEVEYNEQYGVIKAKYKLAFASLQTNVNDIIDSW